MEHTRTAGARMRRSRRARRWALSLLLSAALFALVQCSARQDITLSVDGRGTADIDIRLDEIFIRYLRDLSGSVGGDEDDLRIFDVEEIRRRLSERPGIEVESIGRAGPGLLSLSVSFDDVGALLARENTSFLTLERSGGRSRLEILVSRDAVEEALSYSPLEGSTATEMLLPPAEMGTEEYTEYLVWALEEYEESEALRRKIAESSIELRVRVDGEITSQTGGVRSGDVVTFDVPLVELLTRSSPRRYSVEFR
ncbi:MAG: hypothetical protein ACLFPO_10555 [Spirochaetaceae bacterium]